MRNVALAKEFIERVVLLRHGSCHLYRHFHGVTGQILKHWHRLPTLHRFGFVFESTAELTKHCVKTWKNDGTTGKSVPDEFYSKSQVENGLQLLQDLGVITCRTTILHEGRNYSGFFVCKHAALAQTEDGQCSFRPPLWSPGCLVARPVPPEIVAAAQEKIARLPKKRSHHRKNSTQGSTRGSTQGATRGADEKYVGQYAGRMKQSTDEKEVVPVGAKSDDGFGGS